MRIATSLAVTVISLSLLTACSTTSPSSEPTTATSAVPSSKPTTATPTTPSPVPTNDVSDVEVYPNKPTTTTLSCSEAVAAAAAVPGDENVNDAVYVSLIACGSVDEWGAAIVAYPSVFAVTSVPPSEIEFYAMIVCLGAEETPVCADAAARGIL